LHPLKSHSLVSTIVSTMLTDN